MATSNSIRKEEKLGSYTPSSTEFLTPLGWSSDIIDQARKTAFFLGHHKSCEWPSQTVLNPLKHWTQNTAKNGKTRNYTEFHSLLECPVFSESRPVIVGQINIFITSEEIPPMQYTFAFDDDIDFELYHNSSFDHQPAFLGQTKFAPSDTLVSMWANGINSYIKEASYLKKSKESPLTAQPNDLIVQFADKFQTMIATLANLKRRGDWDCQNFSDAHSFSIEVQHEILDRFFVKPSDHSRFIFQLYSEIVAYLNEGGVIKGKWGEIVLRKGSPILVLSALEKETLPSFD